MYIDDRFTLMKNDLCKAASTIHKLKKERDEYRISYELLKDETVSRKEIIKNEHFLEELRETNEYMRSELMRFKRLLLEKDRTIAGLEKTIQNSNKKFKEQLQNFKELEIARKELKNELNNTNLSKENYSMYSEIVNMTGNMIRALKKNPSIYKIFKERVQCKKRFFQLVEQENYSACFKYLLKFVMDLLETFQFCDENEESPTFISNFEDARFTNESTLKGKNYYKEETDEETNKLKESLVLQSRRIEKLNQDLSKITSESKNGVKKEERLNKFERDLRIPENDSKASAKNLKINPEILTESKGKKRNDLKINVSGTFSSRTVDEDANFSRASIRQANNSKGSIKNLNTSRSVSKSKSPSHGLRALNDKYQEHMSPIIRKSDCWGSTADYFYGEKSNN